MNCQNPSPTPPHKGEGLYGPALDSRSGQDGATGFLPPCGGDGRQARRGIITKLLIALFLLLTPIQAFAVNPDEVLKDPALEQRARQISAQLRCMVCQNQSIDDSNAELAKDLRVLVRQRLTDGDTDKQVVDYVVSRYGEFVLLNPRLSSKTIILWSMPIGLLIAGIFAIVIFVRSRPARRPSEVLSAEEKAKIDELLGK
ncbi:Cytochrome c-type biogenesis protein CcmH precursor [compost metagenome]